MSNKKCVICDIINNAQKGYIVFENDAFIAFLDHHPLFYGHCLLSPKQHVEDIYGIGNDLTSELLLRIQKIGKAVQTACQSQGTFIAINNTVSQSIPHLHIHIVPRNKGDGLKGFFWPRTKYQNEAQLIEVRDKIKASLSDRRRA